MMRRFTRRRRGGPRSGATPIDVESLLEKILAQGIVPAEGLTPLAADEIPAGMAALASGEAKSGGRLLVAVSLTHAGHAVLAALAVAGRLAEAEAFSGDVYVVAPDWEGAGRRILAAVGKLPFRLKAVAAPSLVGEGAVVAAEPVGLASGASSAQIAGYLSGPADRDLFLRAARSLEGLAAKHTGALRGHGRAVEFTLLARRVAELRAEEDGVVLVTHFPKRATNRLTPENLSGALDGLEGQLRKRLNDRAFATGKRGCAVVRFSLSGIGTRCARWFAGPSVVAKSS